MTSKNLGGIKSGMKYFTLILFLLFCAPLWAYECEYQIKLEQPQTSFTINHFDTSIEKSMKKLNFKIGYTHSYLLVLKLSKTFDYHNGRKKRALVLISLYDENGNLISNTFGNGHNRFISDLAYSATEYRYAIKKAIENLAICYPQE